MNQSAIERTAASSSVIACGRASFESWYFISLRPHYSNKSLHRRSYQVRSALRSVPSAWADGSTRVICLSHPLTGGT